VNHVYTLGIGALPLGVTLLVVPAMLFMRDRKSVV